MAQDELQHKKGFDLGSINRVLESRRAWVALFAILCMMIVGLYNKIDTTAAIASVAIAVAAANGYEKKGKSE